MTVTDILWTLAGPFGLVFVFLTAIWRPWRSDTDVYDGWPLPVALASAYALGHIAISSVLGFPAVTADDWLFFVAIGAGCWGVVEARFESMPNIARYAGRLAVFGTGFGLMFGDYLSAIALGGLLIATMIWVAALELAADAGEGATTLWSVIIVSGAAGGLFVLGASLKLALLIWGLMSATAAVAVVSINTGSRLRIKPALTVIGVVLIGLFVASVLFARVPAVSAVAVAIALVIPLGIGAAPLISEMSRWKRRVIQFGLVIAISVGAVGYVHLEFNVAEEQSEESGEDEDDDNDEDDPYSW